MTALLYCDCVQLKAWTLFCFMVLGRESPGILYKAGKRFSLSYLTNNLTWTWSRPPSLPQPKAKPCRALLGKSLPDSIEWKGRRVFSNTTTTPDSAARGLSQDAVTHHQKEQRESAQTAADSAGGFMNPRSKLGSLVQKERTRLQLHTHVSFKQNWSSR